MAKRRAEDTPPAALWKDTFSDLMNLLLCFFVLLFSMSTVDSQKFEEIAASLSSSFSVLPSGGSALSKEGILVSSGASQLNDLSTYYNNMGLNTDADMSQDVQSAYDEVEKEGLEESENMAEEIENKLLQSGVADQVEVTAYSKYVMLNVSGGILFDSGKAELTCAVAGCGRFRAIANGDPTSLELFHEPHMHAFGGQLTVIVQAGTREGQFTLVVEGKGLTEGTATMNVVR